ncbi:MAG: twin-arginine translocase TatA/TatE family subunit [Polyangiaceae bacterium]|nr:twin-arginine translocase TatA/TatE family subunit [Polyangiaceae bacterium]
MGSLSLFHWVVVIVILLLVFGPKRLSEVGKGLGQGIRNFKKGIEGGEGGEGDEKSPEGEAEAPRLKKGASTKKLEGRRKPQPEPDDDDDDDVGDDDAGDDEEEARPRKKSKRA